MTFVDSGGVQIFYTTEGEGTPILLHTGAGGDHRMWRMAGYTAGLNGHRLISMDHRGHGASDRPSGIEDHRIDRYVDDVLEVIDTVSAERVVFLGYSDGASVGYAFAAAYPDRMAALIGIGAVGAENDAMSERAAEAAWIRTEGTSALVHALREAEPDSVPDWFTRQMLETDADMLALELEAWADWGGPWSVFPLIEAPTLIIGGQHEEGPSGIATRHARQAAARIPDGRCAILAGLGHVGAFVRTDLVIPLITSFLRDVARGRGGGGSQAMGSSPG